MTIANTTIQIKKSLTSGNTPSTLANGEIAINSVDGKLYYSTPSGSINYITNQQSFAKLLTFVNKNLLNSYLRQKVARILNF